MTAQELAARIDHTILVPEASAEAVHRAVHEATEHQFATLVVAPMWVRKVAIELAGTGVKVGSVAGFPHGTSKPTIKAIEATSVIKDGADEVDFVAFLPHLISGNLEAAREEFTEVVRSARATRRDVIIKVIVETAVLMKLPGGRGEAAIELACRAVRESGCDFIKTSTGLHPAGGASLEAVRLMRKYGEGILVKAAGGIRDAATARAMIEAGAHRIGTSASVAIVALKPQMNTDEHGY